MRDSSRNAVYAVEDGLAAVLDRGGRYDFYGSVLDVSPDKKFTSIEEVQFYVNIWSEQLGMIVPPRVRKSRATSKATYRSLTHTISLPPEMWSLRALVVLHELSHAVVHKVVDYPVRIRREAGGSWEPTAAAHGPEWQQVYVDAVDTLISREAALILNAGFNESC